MIRSLNRALFSLVALVGLAGTANAAYVPATWTDDYSVGTGVLIGGAAPSSYSYFHDITSDNFNVGSDFVTNFLVTINLFDDNRGFFDFLEIAFVDLPGLSGDTFWSSFSGNSVAGWSIAGVFELNLLGTLSVTITALTGDFMFGGSNLVANGYAKVPEPSTIALLGLGLLGIAAGARRKANRA